MKTNIWKKIRNWLLGTIFGLVVIWMVARYLHPDMTILELVKVIVESYVGWSW